MILALLAAALQAAPPAAAPVTPASVVAAAPASEWVKIAPDDLLVMDLAPDAAGRPRRVVIQLMPAPFSQGWVRNIRTLARAHWWDGLSVNRVQDNYVAQWGDPDSDDKAKAKPLPGGLERPTESDYVHPSDTDGDFKIPLRAELWAATASPSFSPAPAFRGTAPWYTDSFYRGFAVSSFLSPHASEAFPVHSTPPWASGATCRPTRAPARSSTR